MFTCIRQVVVDCTIFCGFVGVDSSVEVNRHSVCGHGPLLEDIPPRLLDFTLPFDPSTIYEFVRRE